MLSVWVYQQKLVVQAVMPECSCCQIIRREAAGTGCDAWMFMLSRWVHQERNCWSRLWCLNVHVNADQVHQERSCWSRLWCLNVHVSLSSPETAGTGYDTWMFMLSDQVHQEKLLVQAMTPECSCCQIKFIKRETAGTSYDTWMFMLSDQVHQKRNCWCRLWHLNVHVIRSSSSRETAGTGYDTWMFMLSDQVHQMRNCWCRLWHLYVLLLLCVCVLIKCNVG